MQSWSKTNIQWRDYYAARWERAGRDSLLQLALFYHFEALRTGEIE